MNYKKGCLVLFLLGLIAAILIPALIGKSVASKETVELMRLKVFGMALHAYLEQYGKFPKTSGELQPFVQPEPYVDNIAEHLALYHDFETGG